MEKTTTISMTSTYKLNNGVDMPLFGLGTWKAKGNDVGKSCQWAIEAGYRHIDTASLYANEEEIGEFLAKSEVKREDVFITSKIWND
jgi:diketogulonate reductase-like aldo/keto reductase